MTFTDICDRIAQLYVRSELNSEAVRIARNCYRFRLPSRLPSLTNRRDASALNCLAFR